MAAPLVRHTVLYWRLRWPIRAFELAFRLLFNFLKIRVVSRTISRCTLRQKATTTLRFGVKCFDRNYLSRSLGIDAQIACFTHHFETLACLFPADIFDRLKHGVLALCTQDTDRRLQLTLAPPLPEVREGELSLSIESGGINVFRVLFTIVPGTAVGASSRDVLLISCLQGGSGCGKQVMHLATRGFRAVRPPDLLLAALQGVALGLGIHEITAVPGPRQCSYQRQAHAYWTQRYDDFFTRSGMTLNQAGFYHATIPLESKPLSEVSPKSRSKARRRRKMKRIVMEACAEAIRKLRAPAGALPASSSDGSAPPQRDLKTAALVGHG